MSSTRTVRLTVIAADGLIKKDLFFKLPDPFGTYSHVVVFLYLYSL